MHEAAANGALVFGTHFLKQVASAFTEATQRQWYSAGRVRLAKMHLQAARVDNILSHCRGGKRVVRTESAERPTSLLRCSHGCDKFGVEGGPISGHLHAMRRRLQPP